MKKLFFAFFVLLLCQPAFAREQIKVVGSSTVYPFSSFVAEEFGSVSRYPTPIVESTGTGGGMKLFCSGNGMNTPDITNASRRIKIKELELCQRNGVSNISEVMFGYDGIVIAQNVDKDPIELTVRDLLLALAKMVPNKSGNGLVENTYEYWDEVNPDLPRRKIKVYGPPVSSGTRDAFEEIVLQYQTEGMKVYRDAGLKGYRLIRTDGLYIPSGENDNLIVQKLTKDKDAFGIFGYSFLAENSDIISGININGYKPTSENIASKKYPISRSLFIYVKNDHIKEVPAMEEFLAMFLDPAIIGEEGLLTEIGLIPMDEGRIDAAMERVDSKESITLDELKLALRDLE